ncbi:hypothetical protein DAPPUDRAFT_239906 [Daphnia pulex]|uniref:Uncharacterized protein n=1 Tax=Daphnia pulex TaxID=6669 RepID=E9GAE1_DAPPU|nr:hypothetical protein DAPPUDRAFT_239906 [Daphnia pulex]|eukprot:EFX83539.1 hypothetical protein DAPPUDRAFT_239906 [Daphnia pulex]
MLLFKRLLPFHRLDPLTTFEVFVGTDLQSARDQQIKWPNPYCKFESCLPTDQHHPNPRNFYLQDPFQSPATPIPSNNNLQKERHTHPQKLQPAEGLSKVTEIHYIKRVMQ